MAETEGIRSSGQFIAELPGRKKNCDENKLMLRQRSLCLLQSKTGAQGMVPPLLRMGSPNSI